MRRVLTHSVYVLLVLGGTMGALPEHTTQPPPSEPSFMPVPVPQTAAAKPSTKPYQVGRASWYGGFFQGRPTASGEDYNMYDFTAAHRELPLGTYVKVTDLANGRSVVVRVNDRGPVVPGRIIDLSYGAARSLGMSKKGLQRVRLDIMKPEEAELAMLKDPAVRH